MSVSEKTHTQRQRHNGGCPSAAASRAHRPASSTPRQLADSLSPGVFALTASALSTSRSNGETCRDWDLKEAVWPRYLRRRRASIWRRSGWWTRWVTDSRGPLQPRSATRNAELALRADGRHARPRRRIHQPATPGRAGAVRVVPRPGGRADRGGGVPAQDRLVVPQYREIGVFLLRGITPAQMGAVWRGKWHGGHRVHRAVLRADRHPHRHPRLACGGRGDGSPAAGRGFGDAGVPRRRRHQRG